MTPEWSRPERLDAIGEAPRAVAIEADEAERAALARRFALPAIEALAARLTLRREAAGIAVSGRVTAQVTQACSLSGEPVAATVDEPIDLLFVEPAASADEVELDDRAIDTVEIEGGAIDLGEVAAETMMLALAPFPRAPGAEEALRAAGLLGDEAGPFAGLAALRDRLG